MNFLPDLSVLLTYSLASVVLIITPGPDMSLFLAKTLAGGRRAGMASMLGALAGAASTRSLPHSAFPLFSPRRQRHSRF